MSKGSTQVDSPNPYAVADADARYNRINQFTPYGNLTFDGPYRNQANLNLNPAVQDLENRRLLSDRLMTDTALSRQADIKGGSLPSLTEGINPGAMNEFFGLPTSLQQGTDSPANVPDVPDAIGMFDQRTARPGNIPGQYVQGETPLSDPYNTTQQQFAPTVQNQPQMSTGLTAPGKLQPGPTSQEGGQNQQSDSFFGGKIGEIIDPNTFGQIGSLDQLEDFELDRGRVEQNYFDRASSLLNPQFDQAQQAKVSDLRARGIPRDSEAFEREMANFNRSKGETFGRLANDAVLQGGGEQSRLFGLSSALGDRAQGAQSQLFNMADLLGQRDIQTQLQQANVTSSNRATQVNELASLLGLQQVASPQLNNFFTPGQADVGAGFALQQQANQGNANRNAGMKGGLLGGATDLGTAAIGK